MADDKPPQLDYASPGQQKPRETRMGFRVLAGFFAVFVWLVLGIISIKFGIHSGRDLAGLILLGLFALGLSVACLRPS